MLGVLTRHLAAPIISRQRARQEVHRARENDAGSGCQLGDFRIALHVRYPIARELILTTSPGWPKLRQYQLVSVVEDEPMVCELIVWLGEMK